MPPPQPINPEEEQRKIEEGNFRLFREVLGSVVIERSRRTVEKKGKKKKSRKLGKAWKGKKVSESVTKEDEKKETKGDEKAGDVGGHSEEDGIGGDDREELGEFIDYLTTEIFTSFPFPLRTLTYTTHQITSSLSIYTPPISPTTLLSLVNTIPVSINETLNTYLFPSSSVSTTSNMPNNLLKSVLNGYLEEILKKPIPPRNTKEKAEGCEICGRGWIPLTYHHLIPRGVHGKALKKGWWGEERLGDVAWVCRGCHSFIHSVATNEELAREYYSVERLLEREDVVAFAKWIGGVRWKAR